MIQHTRGVGHFIPLILVPSMTEQLMVSQLVASSFLSSLFSGRTHTSLRLQLAATPFLHRYQKLCVRAGRCGCMWCLCRTFSSHLIGETPLCVHTPVIVFVLLAAVPQYSRRNMNHKSFGHIVIQRLRLHCTRARPWEERLGLGFGLGLDMSFGSHRSFSLVSVVTNFNATRGTKYLSKQSSYLPVPLKRHCASGTRPSFIFPYSFRYLPSRSCQCQLDLLAAVASGYSYHLDPCDSFRG